MPQWLDVYLTRKLKNFSYYFYVELWSNKFFEKLSKNTIFRQFFDKKNFVVGSFIKLSEYLYSRGMN